MNDRIRLFKDFNANIGYQSLRDNLNGTEKATTTYNDIFFGFNVFSSVNYPTLSANYRIRLVGNNGERNLFIGDDGNGVMDTTITDTRKDIQSNYYSLNLSQNFYFNNTNNDITASFTSSGRTDAFQPVGNSDYTATSLILRTLYSNALETRLTATLGRTEWGNIGDRLQYLLISNAKRVFQSRFAGLFRSASHTGQWKQPDFAHYS